MEKESYQISDEEIANLESDYPELLDKQIQIIKSAREDASNTAEVLEEERIDFMHKLALGEIKARDILRKIRNKEGFSSDLTQEVEAKDKLQGNPAYRILLNLMQSREPHLGVSVPRIMEILEKYPEPYDFEDLLEEVSAILEPEYAADLERHGRELARMLYGEREIQWEQLKLMESEGRFIFVKEIEEKEKGYILSELSPKEAEKLLGSIEVHGDEWSGEFLTADYLYAHGLEPHYKMEIDGQIIWFSSRPFNLERKGRIAVIGYFESGSKLVARSFYESNSQGVWRYLPKYLKRGEKISWFHKGFDEQSISLPVPLQRALADIKINHDPVNVEGPEFIFAGTARNMANIQDGMITYEGSVSEFPTKLKGNFYDKSVIDPLKTYYGKKKNTPESLVFTEESEKPNFEKRGVSWTYDSPEYGRVRAQTFYSKDGKLQYMFCTDKLGRTWIATIDTNSPITSTGLRARWIDAGDLVTPAFEYESQDHGYGNYDIKAGDHYVDMYKNYLSKIPIIQEFEKHQRK